MSLRKPPGPPGSIRITSEPETVTGGPVPTANTGEGRLMNWLIGTVAIGPICYGIAVYLKWLPTPF